MRFHRIITAFMALFVAAVMTVGVTTSVQAQADQPSQAAAKAKAKEKRPLKAFPGEIRNSGKFQVHGVVGNHVRRNVYLAQKPNKKAKWRRIKADKTDGRGKFRINFDGPAGSCYRLEIEGNSRYRGRVAGIGCIVRQ